MAEKPFICQIACPALNGDLGKDFGEHFSVDCPGPKISGEMEDVRNRITIHSSTKAEEEPSFIHAGGELVCRNEGLIRFLDSIIDN